MSPAGEEQVVCFVAGQIKPVEPGEFRQNHPVMVCLGGEFVRCTFFQGMAYANQCHQGIAGGFGHECFHLASHVPVPEHLSLAEMSKSLLLQGMSGVCLTDERHIGGADVTGDSCWELAALFRCESGKALPGDLAADPLWQIETDERDPVITGVEKNLLIEGPRQCPVTCIQLLELGQRELSGSPSVQLVLACNGEHFKADGEPSALLLQLLDDCQLVRVVLGIVMVLGHEEVAD